LKASRRIVCGVATFALVVIVGVAFAAQYFQVKIPATGNIVALNVAVFNDPTCSIPIVRIDWGMLGPGESKTVACYIKSLSNVDSSLSMSAANWTSSQASFYLSVAWKRARAFLSQLILYLRARHDLSIIFLQYLSKAIMRNCHDFVTITAYHGFSSNKSINDGLLRSLHSSFKQRIQLTVQKHANFDKPR